MSLAVPSWLGPRNAEVQSPAQKEMRLQASQTRAKTSVSKAQCLPCASPFTQFVCDFLSRGSGGDHYMQARFEPSRPEHERVSPAAFQVKHCLSGGRGCGSPAVNGYEHQEAIAIVAPPMQRFESLWLDPVGEPGRKRPSMSQRRR